MLKPTVKSSGTNLSERYLSRLCEATFFGLWAYPNLYRSEGINKNGTGQELCDLLVVFGSKVIIFSDKSCKFDKNAETTVAWKRWYRKSILSSVRQLLGARKWLLEYPSNIYLDKECQNNFPLELDAADLEIHLIAVVDNVHNPAEKRGSDVRYSSFFQNFTVDGLVPTNQPFTIGRMVKGDAFIHVLDKYSLNFLVNQLSTVSDFITYLSSKDKAISGGEVLAAAGEEELLALYFSNQSSFYDFGEVTYKGLDRKDSKPVLLQVGRWQEYTESREYQILQQIREISSYWDYLISLFSKHILEADVATAIDQHITVHEKALRALASENRASRYTLSAIFQDKFKSLPSHVRSSRLAWSPIYSDRLYIFLFIPYELGSSYEHYRLKRSEYMSMYAEVAKFKNESANQIVVIATEPPNPSGRSEDICVYDTSGKLDQKARIRAKALMREHKILTEIKEIEYRPLAPEKQPGRQKVGRNTQCPCGSGKKFKKCCLDAD